MMELKSRHRELLRTLRREGPLSRWQLHQRLGIRPNTVSDTAADLVERGILVEAPQQAGPMGRPRTPLKIDPSSRHVVGLAIRPGFVEIARLNLEGKARGEVLSRDISEVRKMIPTCCDMLRQQLDDHALAVGISVTGTIDPIHHLSLVSSSLPGQRNVSLDPLYKTVGVTPMLLENDMVALAARWVVQTEVQPDTDVLLVSLGDGVIGGAILVDGGPKRGYITVDNELGHLRLPVDTPPCYCGQRGCLSMILATDFLRRRDPKSPPLAQRIVAYRGDDPLLEQVLDHTATVLVNAINLLSSDRVVLTGDILGDGPFTEALLRRVRDGLLFGREKVTRIERWGEPASRPSQTAAWLGLAWLFLGGWTPEPTTHRKKPRRALAQLSPRLTPTS